MCLFNHKSYVSTAENNFFTHSYCFWRRVLCSFCVCVWEFKNCINIKFINFFIFKTFFFSSLKFCFIPVRLFVWDIYHPRNISGKLKEVKIQEEKEEEELRKMRVDVNFYIIKSLFRLITYALWKKKKFSIFSSPWRNLIFCVCCF